ncbi:hypothetical protein [Catellatospora tritici]|uniref:hypothetical protein n=1 Tax=Catellatospora tritici TaxID=2851566 RepID=UPI001C2DEB89|nr:hypothetical protein [Catellatospora tritici]MBV1854606.1 hypothetical protein [Catellatospora tritici]
MRRKLTPLALVAVLALGGCTREPDLQQKSEAEVVTALRSYADDIGTVFTMPITNFRTNTVACEQNGGVPATDGTFDLSGHGKYIVKPGSHVALLRSVAEHWLAQGYEVDPLREVGNGGQLTGRNPADGISVTLTSGDPEVIAFLAATPCYKSR